MGRHDRLTENACLCLEQGVNPECLIQSIANGMAYDEPEDPAAQIIQGWIAEEGIGEAAAKVMGLSADSELVLRVAEAWRGIGSRKED